MATNDLLALVQKKQAEIAKLQAELDDVRRLLLGESRPATANGPRSGREPKRKKQRLSFPQGHAGGRKKRKRRRQSSVSWAEAVVAENGAPLHVNEMIKRIDAKFHQEVDKQTLVSNLARLSKAKDRFERTAPNTFGLIGGK